MAPRGILRVPNRTARAYLFPIKCLSTEDHRLRGDPPEALVTERLFGAPAWCQERPAVLPSMSV
jgi:hypothetical protein